MVVARPRLETLAAEVAAHRHGRVPADLRREHVIAVAEALFAERGYQHASMDELAQRAGVSKPVVYTLVGSKDELFRTCVERAAHELATRVEAAFAAESDPAARLYAGGLAFFTFVREAGSAWDALLSGEGSPAAATVRAAREQQARIVADLLARTVIERGGTPDPRALDATAHAINGTYEGLAAWWQQQHPERQAHDMAEFATRLLAPGILALVTDPRDS